MNIVKREAVENGRRRRRLVVSAVLLALLPATQAARGQSLPDSLASLAGAVLPAVVIVTASGELAPEVADEGGPAGALMRELLGEAAAEGRRQPVATGVILDPGGVVVTAAHAVRGVSDLEAITTDGVAHKAIMVGSDPKTDLAVLRLVGGGPFAVAVLGDSAAVRAGDWGLVIGTPYGLGATVTAGIISAVVRPRNPVDLVGDADAARYGDALHALGPDAADAMVIILTPQAATDALGVARAVSGATRSWPIPRAAAFVGGARVAAGARALEEAGIPCYAFPEPAVRALAGMALSSLRRARRHQPPGVGAPDEEAR